MIDINNFDAITIGLASSQQIRSWSSGEVTKPETINYRTLKPEKDGLFCERIFGPTKDWECYCGKYKRVRVQGHRLRALRRRGHPLQGPPRAHGPRRPGRARVAHLVLQGRPVADRLPDRHGSEGAREGPLLRGLDGHAGRRRGAREGRDRNSRRRSRRCSTRYDAEQEERVKELAESRERRARVPETGKQTGFSDDDHLWARRARHQRQEALRRGPREAGEGRPQGARVRHPDTEAYIEDAAERMRQVWDLFREMKPKEVIADETLFRELKDRFGSPYGFGEYFRGGMGAEAVRDLLEQVDLDAEREELEEQVKTAKGQKQSRAVKRLKVVSAFINSDNKPEDMILEAIPVIPPELRPMVQLDGGRFATSDLNDLYRARHQPEQPPQAAARPRRARDHRQQREADAAGGRRRAVRQRPPRPPGHGPRQPARSSRSPTCSRASRAASARTCSASASTTRAAR